LRSLFALALRDFRDATGILNIDGEIQCCRPLPARQKITVLTAFVDTGDVQKVSNVWRWESINTIRPRRVHVRGTQLTLRVGWPHRPDALRFIFSTGQP
jgi:hypothetical protein